MSNDSYLRITELRPALVRTRLTTAIVFALCVLLLQGCAAMVLGGVAAGASVAHERRHSRVVVEDQQTEILTKKLLIEDPDIRKHSRISTTSYNHWVLLTGQAQTQEIADRFANKVAQLPRVRKVINEVELGPTISFARESEDVLITSRVKIALTKVDIPGFDPTRVKVVTENGAVFLMGLVYPREADEAAEKARYIPGVTKVVKVFELIAS
jgi:osmotically-inducible protein OsmY